MIVALAFMLIRRVGWRALAAATLAAAIPLVSYAAAFDAATGQFNTTSSDGIFLWSRTTSFANCAIIKPPRRLQPLCPDRETLVKVPPAQPWSVSRLLNAPTPADYLWAPDAWWKHDAHPGINAYNDQLGMQFALDAIRAQPLAYLRVSARDAALALLAADRPPGNGPRGSMARAAGLICPAWPSKLPPRPGTATSLTCIPPRARSPIWTGGGARRCMPARSALSSGSTPRAR